ncbi:MAG: alanine aminotransferase [Candidatus Nitrosocaldaceae archaeon]|nr:MAG: alanine aminotransferase [Candidatus Nitrosocaldaceae archaeon]
MKISKRIGGVEYAIRDITLYAKELEKKGRDILYLNIGDPVLYDFKTPEHIKEALINAVRSDKNYYPASEGIIELRNKIVDIEKRKGMDLSIEDVIITNGVSEGIYMLMASIVDEGDEVLVPGPCYPPYSSYTKLFGGKPIEYRCSPENNWMPDIDDLKQKINEKTVAIVIINPNNPTGAVYDKDVLKEISDLASSNNIYLICDEIYDRIVFEDRFTSIASIAKDAPLIMLNGFSKVYLMTGWRLGYLCMNDKVSDDLKRELPKLARLRVSSNMPVQYAALEALSNKDYFIKDMVEKLKERRDYIVKRLDGINGLDAIKPRGAFYIFPKIDLSIGNWRNDLDFVKELLEETGVLTVNGSGFGKQYGSGFFRIVYLPPMDILEESMDRLEAFMNKRSKG